LVAALEKLTNPDRFLDEIRAALPHPQVDYLQRLYADTIHKFEQCFDPRVSRWSTFFFDSHYYFTPETLSQEHWFFRTMHTAFVTGGNFFSLSGHYMLPNNEGTYVVENGRITMSTRGGDEFYDHRHNNYDNANYSFHSGWYTWFSDEIPYELLHTKIRMVDTPRGGM